MSSPSLESLEETLRHEVVHSRRCDHRKICSCVLRLENLFFIRKLEKSVRSKRKRYHFTTYHGIKNLKDFDFHMKKRIAMYLYPKDIAKISMVSKDFHMEFEAIAQAMTQSFIQMRKRHDHQIILPQQVKSNEESWIYYMHKQMFSIYKVLVYYTAYRTGSMRSAQPQDAFGIVYIDPNAPGRSILPHTWKFHEHYPWLKTKHNGTSGEWNLKETYRYERASKQFKRDVLDWSRSIRPGSFLTAAYQNVGDEIPKWWEAQVWYVWWTGGSSDSEPVQVCDSFANQIILVHPEELLTHFQLNPLHVIDVGIPLQSVCSKCSVQNRSFYTCHIERGHLMK